jgi:hypothetical protein
VAADTSAQIRELVETHPVLRNLSDSERAVAIGVVNGAVIAVADVLYSLDAERDRYRAALEDIERRATVERNPDGDDQAAATMQLIAREALHPERSNGTA